MAIDFDAIRNKLNQLSGNNSRRNMMWRPEEGTTSSVRLIAFPDNDGQPFKERWFYYNIGNKEPIGVINKDSIYVRPTRFHNDPNFKSYSEQIYDNIDWNELNNKGKKYKNSLLDLVGRNNNYFNPYTEK